MSEENKALYRGFIENVINAHNADAAEQFLAEDFVDHDAPPGLPPGREGMRQQMDMFFGAFPDMRTSIDDLVAEGDMVVGRHTTTSTHKGDFMGIPATGKQVKVNEIHWVRIVGGKAKEHWAQVDMLGMMTQLGVIPAPGEGG